jgi:RNA polymerase sigma-70 factor, ECF subfamily
VDGERGGTTRKAVEIVWRIESPRLIGGLVAVVRDVGLAEDLAQEALVTALERWPEMGIPENPGAWLMAAAKNRAIDLHRRRQMQERKHDAIDEETSRLSPAGPDLETVLDENVGDDLLRLVLITCHPVLSAEARVALTLRLLGGLTTDEIARAFLVPEPTIAQRIVRAKRTLGEARVPFEVPRGPELSARLPSALEAIYLVFNEGYVATKGDDWTRPDLGE